MNNMYNFWISSSKKVLETRVVADNWQICDMIKDKVSYTQFIFWYGRSCKKISCHCSINFENLLWLGHFAFKLYFGELPATAHSPELKTTGSWNFQMIYDYEPNFSLRKIDRTIVSRSFRQSLKFMGNDIVHWKGGWRYGNDKGNWYKYF